MWIPVVDDSKRTEAHRTDENVIEAIVEVIPDAVLSSIPIEFVWLRALPTHPLPDKLIATFRSEANVEERLAALVRDDLGTVLEVYVDNVESGLTDAWLQREWGICRGSLNLSATEKLELTLFAVLVHASIRHGLVQEAKQLVQKIGRVIFRAAVRATMKNLKQTYPEMTVDRVTPSLPKAPNALRTPIGDSEAARIDYDRLFRDLLGLEPPDPHPNDSETPPHSGA